MAIDWWCETEEVIGEHYLGVMTDWLIMRQVNDEHYLGMMTIDEG